ncbi:unnamed protein product [Prunus brigantina]
MVSQDQSKDSGSKKNGGKELGMVTPQEKSSKKMKFVSSSAETEPTSTTTISEDSKSGRGMSTMPRVVKRKLQKIKPIVEYNKRGKGIGQAQSEIQSYIGVLARSRVPLVDKKWAEIPKDIKEQIWEAVDMAFVIREKLEYNHRLSRKGYAGLEDQLEETMPGVEIDRSTLWKRARQDKHGNIPDPKDELQKQVSEGKVSVSGSNDVLTMALGPEHPGRVRGVGAGISPRQYFNLPKPQRMSFDDRLKDSLRVLLQEETKKMEAKAREEALRMEARTKQLVEAEREHFLSQISQFIPNFDPSMLKPRISQSSKNPMSDKASRSGGDVRSLHFEDDTAKNGEHQEEKVTYLNFEFSKNEEKKDEQKEEGKKVEEKEEEKKDEEKKEEKQDEKEKEDEEKHDDKVIEGVDYSNMEVPSSLKSLCRYVETTLVPQEKIMNFTIDKEVFGTIADRSRLVVSRLQKTDGEQIFMMPYNPGHHWVLLIVRAKRETVYFLDPLPGNRVVDEEGKNIVNSAIKIYNSHIAREGRKAPIWKTLSGTPKQPSSVECGYYVMRFMRDIIMDPSLAFEKKGKEEAPYPQEAIDELFGVGIIRDHLYFNGVDQSYKNWTFHREPWEATTNASRNVEEDDGHSRYSFVSEEIDMDDNDFGDFGSDPYEFANVIGDGDQPVYPGCRKYTKLSALVKLYNLKAKHGMSDVCFTELLILQSDLLPEGNTIPTSMYEAKKTLCALGLSYEKMHACPNDCILYRKEYEDSTNCPTCGISRWKEGKDSILKEGVPAKVVWCFPPTPRFKRMFQSPETAKRKPEYGTPPEPLTGEEVLHMVEDGDRVYWKKKSIFFDLEYWKYLPVRHALDVMHIEKNVCDSIIVVHLVREVHLCGPVYFRWMYPFERYMKVLKGYVQNRTRPEGCIAERYIAEEAVEFCTEHLSDVSTVGVPSSQKMGVSKPLSSCTVSVVDQDLLNQAHLYVLENTEEVLPYIEQHMIHIKTAYPKFRKRTKWLQDKHNSTFIQWLRFKVQSELNEEDNHGVSEILRWLAAGPNMAVPLYRSYLIKGIKFNIKAQDDVRTTQNSGVYLLAHTMQVASAKDKNPILSNMGFYGVIQEIWDLDYQKFTIPVFRYDWIDSTSGLVVDELGFTLVDLSKIGHRNDQFVLASQVKQVFFVDDPMHRGWSVVLSMPNREYNDVIGDEVLGDVRIECEPFTRGMPNVDTFDELVGELGGQNIRDGCEDIWIE